MEYRGNQKDEEMGHFDPNPYEPREPFESDEMLAPGHDPQAPSLSGLHLPSAPLNGQKLKNFIGELGLIIEEVQQMSRQDQHLMATYLQQVKNEVHAAGFSSDIVELFEKVTDHFNHLLISSRPIDQKEVLTLLHELEQHLD